MDKHKHLQTFFFFGLLIGAIILAFLVFRPYFYPLILAGTLAIVFYPLHKKILSMWGGKKTWASLTTLFIIFAIVIIPLSLFGLQIFHEAKLLYEGFSSGRAGVADGGVFLFLKENTSKLFPFISSFDVSAHVEKLADWFVKNIGSIFSSVVEILIGFFITFLALFFFLRDGEKLRKSIFFYSPLDDKYDREIFDTVAATANSVIRGSLIIAVIQGIAAGVGFAIFGIPNPALWGAMTVIAALIPAVGTLITLLPAVLYLFFINNVFFAIGLAAWGIFIVSTVDNILRPQIIGKHVKIHPLVIFLSVLGGIQFFGAMGFLLGPLVAGFLFSLLNIYTEMEEKKR